MSYTSPERKTLFSPLHLATPPHHRTPFLYNMLAKLTLPLLGGVGLGIAASQFYAQTTEAASSKKLIVSTKNAPGAIGPYSQGVKAGNLLFVSGCIGLTPESGKMIEGGVIEQTRQSLNNMKAILQAGGSTPEDVVKTTVLLSDMKDYAAVNEIYKEVFNEGKPARAAFAVKGLPAGALVEIDAVAICSE
jgi:2-iminobutanoate/2-iminopropanoate deaminase